MILPGAAFMVRLISALTLTLLLGGALLSAAWDEPLEEELAAWLAGEPRRFPDEHNGYFAIIGLFAEAGADPWAVGGRRARAYELERVAGEPGGGGAARDYRSPKRITIDDEIAILCRFEEHTCLTELAERADSISALQERYRVLIERYRALYVYDYFAVPTAPGPGEPTPPLGSLAKTHHLNAAGIGVEFLTGSRLRALEALREDLRFLRRLLAQADTWELKMFAARALATDLHLFSLLLDSPSFVHAHLPGLEEELRDLDLQERSVEAAARREMRKVAAALAALPGDESGPLAQAPRWAHRVFYKGNATLNRAFGRVRQWVRLSGEASERFPAGALGVTAPPPSLREQIVNPLGVRLIGYFSPELADGVALLHDLTALTRLVSLKKRIRAENVPSRELVAFLARMPPRLGSPYDGKPAGWDEARQVLFFPGYSAERRLRAVPLGAP